MTTGEVRLGQVRPASSGLSDSARLVVAVVLACAVLVAVVAGVALAAARDTTSAGLDVDRSMRAELSQRAQVQTAAEAFVVNLNSYSKDDFAGYRDRMAALVTPNFMKAFVLTLDSMKQLVDSTKMSSDGTVLKTAVASVDSDTATVLVVADAKVTSLLGERQRHFRWKVILVNQDGHWRVDDWQAVV